MEQNLLFEAKNIEDAVALAKHELGFDGGELPYTVLEGEKSGPFPWSSEKVKIEVPPLQVIRTLGIVKSLVQKAGVAAEYEVVSGISQHVINIDSEDRGLLIGFQGATLEAVQYLTNIIYNKQYEEKCRVIIDIGGYRQEKHSQLIEQAAGLIEKVRLTGERARMANVNSYDRRSIHLLVSEHDDLISYSEGDDRKKDIFIAPKPDSEA